MKTVIRVIAILGLTMGFCGALSASGDQSIETAVFAPPAPAGDCCIPPNCPPCDWTPAQK